VLQGGIIFSPSLSNFLPLESLNVRSSNDICDKMQHLGHLELSINHLSASCSLDAMMVDVNILGCSSLAAHSADIHQSEDNLCPSEPLTVAFHAEYPNFTEPFLYFMVGPLGMPNVSHNVAKLENPFLMQTIFILDMFFFI
jgi:hypothetical protein